MTVASQVAKLHQRFGLQQVVLVGDRGMLTAARILVNAGAVTTSLFDEHDLAEITSDEFPGERLIVCRNPLLAAERQRKRDELLAATDKELEPVVVATRRNNQPLRGGHRPPRREGDQALQDGEALRRPRGPLAGCGRQGPPQADRRHSFRTLLADLGTLTANTMQVAGSDATFTLQTQPTPLPQRSLELLRMTPTM